MRIYRGINPESVETDSKQPDEYISEWKSGHRIWLKGTKLQSAERETDLFLEIDDADVIALFYALLERYQESEDPALVSELCVEVLSRLNVCLKSTVRPLAPDLQSVDSAIDGQELTGYDRRCLAGAGIKTVGELAQKTALELVKISGGGLLDRVKAELAWCKDGVDTPAT